MRQITANFPKRDRVFDLTAGAARQMFEWFQEPDACRPKSINRSVNFLRWALGFIYLWFGALKFFPGLSSAEGIAGATIELMTFGIVQPNISLPLLALWETLIGLALLTGKFRQAALFSLYFHVAGTMLPLLLLPGQTWSAPPFAATLEGQYIFKNLITVGAVLVINAAESCRE
jgi:uncharacterized membrane protein YphA (DoxX/SURF4 family)